MAFEGLDGAGTTTQAALLRDWLAADGRRVHLTQEPSRGPVGGLLRQFLEKKLPLDMDMGYVETGERLNPAMLALLFAADRLGHLASEVQPHRHKGWIVVSDRYTLSSLAYQSIDCRLEFVVDINALALPPDLTILLDVPVSACQQRIAASRRGLELFDDTERQERVRENYLALAKSWKRSRIKTEILDGDRPIEVVHEDVKRLVGKELGRSRPARTSRRTMD